MSIKYKRLKLKMLTPDLLKDFDRRQQITRSFRAKSGKWIVIDNEYTEDWDDMKKGQILDFLRSVKKNKGILYGAFNDGTLVGFTVVEGKLFGSGKQYARLSMIHVSSTMRHRGIGKELFALAVSSAESIGAKKLYITGHSSVETQAFYRNMGCVETVEYSDELLSEEPYDCHLEYDIKNRGRITPFLMVLGMVVGLCIGYTYDNKAPIFMCLGMVVGSAFGLYFDYLSRKEADSEEKGLQIKEGGETRHPDNL